MRPDRRLRTAPHPSSIATGYKRDGSRNPPRVEFRVQFALRTSGRNRVMVHSGLRSGAPRGILPGSEVRGHLARRSRMSDHTPSPPGEHIESVYRVMRVSTRV